MTTREPVRAERAVGREQLDGGAVPAAPVVVRVAGLGKRFKIYRKPLDRLLEWMGAGKRHTEFWAVRGVSFEVRRGECLGIIGANGSGKSTLLKMVTGALHPTEGTCGIEGRVLSLIELGTGLNQNLSGRANVVHSAALLGFPADYAKRKMAEIEAFADLEAFFDRPVMLYSSGMRVRLAFSMFACFRPDVFIVDEALSVGDVFFQQKCATRVRELLEGGMTMILVSHDQGAILNLCDRVIVMNHGRPEFDGGPEEAVSRYLASLNAGGPVKKWARPAKNAAPVGVKKVDAQDGQGGRGEVVILANDVIGKRAEARHGTGHLLILGARVTDAARRNTMRALMGETLSFHVLLEARERVERPRAGVRFFDRFNNLVFGAGTYQCGCDLPAMKPGDRVVVRFDVTMDVQPGQYSFGLGAGEPAEETMNSGIAHDRIDELGPIVVGIVRESPRPFYGAARLPMRVSHSAVTGGDGA